MITEQRSVGFLPGGHEVFKIEKIACIALSVDSEQDIELKVCSIIIISGFHILLTSLFVFLFT